MAYTLTIHSISPTTAANTGNIGLSINFTLSGSGVSLPGFSLSLYDALSGGSYIKSLYYDDINDLQSGMAYSVSFSGVSPGTYYVEIFYKAPGTTRRAITITGSSSATELITLNGSKVTASSLNGSQITNETVNGVKVFGS
ncbi:hypothetical protein [Acholeplasma laidlawii]|uniref:Uncharacterized protein n=2 Tax=Acholeplasma laidlawii TaxID=2148 RepID=A9NFW2_ACHLI|nr:hypothetical protein [Acholeplasma laidlawii]ABX81242.1 hypothetical protein ACL_0625 [Acholeplasma laidlawii PG-8A]NWH10185.1 hypothetical protein [Acholeplasma laidlawii]NWH11576.1 hypothetical protein [Acholeplasma laidlawii]NWH13015.1 hypothetical protein [Acholeplasma laidlawii]NWH14717.1 hypothetical protein [Acholeplasma laidlawii]